LSTRRISDAAFTGSGQNIMPKRQVAASNVASGKASACMSISRASRLSSPSFCALRVVTATMSGERSVATTRPPGRTRSAAVDDG